MSSTAMMLATGFAGWLDVNDCASWADVSGAYTGATEWPTYIGPDMGTTPHQQLCITPLTPERLRADIVQGLQLRYRGVPDGDPDDVLDRAQRVADLCYPNGFPRGHVQLGYIKAGTIMHGPETLLGRDGQRRYEYVQNFRVRFRRPADAPSLGYTLTEQSHFITSPDDSIRTVVTMTQAEYDALTSHDPTQLVVIVP